MYLLLFLKLPWRMGEYCINIHGGIILKIRYTNKSFYTISGYDEGGDIESK